MVQLWQVHHLLADGMTMELLKAFVNSHIRAERDASPAPSISPIVYSSYVHWQQEEQISSAATESLTYWQELSLEEDAPFVPSPSGPNLSGSEVGVIAFTFPKLQVSFIQHCWLVALQQQLGWHRLVLGFIVHGRPGEWHNAWGHFSRIVPVPIQASELIRDGEAPNSELDPSKALAAKFSQASKHSIRMPFPPVSHPYRATLNVEFNSVPDPGISSVDWCFLDNSIMDKILMQMARVGFIGNLQLTIQNSNRAVLSYNRKHWSEERISVHAKLLAALLEGTSLDQIPRVLKDSLIDDHHVQLALLRAGAKAARCFAIGGVPHVWVSLPLASAFQVSPALLPPYLAHVKVHLCDSIPDCFDKARSLLEEHAQAKSSGLSSTSTDVNAVVLSIVMEVLHTACNMKPSAEAMDAPLMEAGITSVKAVIFAQALSNRVERQLPPTIVYRFSTAREIAAYLHVGDVEATQPIVSSIDSRLGTQTIIVAGVGVQLPGTARASNRSVASVQRIITTGSDVLTEVPAARWTLDSGSLDSSVAARVRHGGFVLGAELFDHTTFSLLLLESSCMDPQQRLLMEHGYMVRAHPNTYIEKCVEVLIF